MLTIAIVALFGLASSVVLTPFFRDFFGFLQVVDHPDSDRKIHKRPIPRVGGVGLAGSYLVALAALLIVLSKGVLDWQDPSIRLMLSLQPAVALIFGAGLWDDIRGLSPLQKLVCEFVAAVYAFLIGVRLGTPPGSSLKLTLLAALLSIFWLVLCTNAINLVDGLDGLAAGVALIAAVSLLVAAALQHRPGLALVMAPMVGCLIGFLCYNFNPATVFLGDCGSLPVGFLLGCYGLMWHRHATSGLGMAAPLVALALPLGEVLLSVARRFLRNRPIFGADSNHIHHRILAMGVSHRGAAMLLYGVSALTASLAVLQTILRPRMATVSLFLLFVAACFGFRRLRYTEFGVLNRFLFAGDFRRLLRIKIQLKEYEQSLGKATILEESWQALRGTCREAGFSYVALCAEGKVFEDILKRASVDRSACLQIPISASEFAVFNYDPGSPDLAMLIAPLVERLRVKLCTGETSPQGLAQTETAVRTAMAS
jgi:UDP-GlcNAc:undecaprenyl-phosphate GlcNAc-1-phosphate transferase